MNLDAISHLSSQEPQMHNFDRSELTRFCAFVSALSSKGLTDSDILEAAYEGKLGTLLGIVTTNKRNANAVPAFVPSHARNRVSALDLLARIDGDTAPVRAASVKQMIQVETSGNVRNVRGKSPFPAMKKFGTELHAPLFRVTSAVTEMRLS